MKKEELTATYSEKKVLNVLTVGLNADYSFQHLALKKADTCGLVAAADGGSDGSGGKANPDPLPGALGPPSLGSRGPRSCSSLLSPCRAVHAALWVCDMKREKKFWNFFPAVVVLFCFSSSSCRAPSVLGSSSSRSRRSSNPSKGRATSAEDAQGTNLGVYQIRTAGTILCEDKHLTNSVFNA